MKSSRPRLACLQIPLFPLAARLRSEPDLQREGTAILEGNGSAARVIAATRIAREAGVTPGMTLPQARARVPKLIARPRDAECEKSAQDVLLEVADQFSPRVEDSGEGRVFLDLSGLARHYAKSRRRGKKDTGVDDSGVEQSLANDLIRELDQASLPIRVGIARSKLAAQIAANLPQTPRIIPNGSEVEFLAPLPLAKLSPAMEVATTLERWGIQSIGELAKLSKAEVVSRLGEIGRKLHSEARGVDPRPLVAHEPPQQFREGMTLEWPLTNLEPFLFIARSALERLLERLERRGLGCKRLMMSLQLEPEGFHERSIDLPSPTREVKTLISLLRLDLEAHTPNAPIEAFHLVAHPDAPQLAQLSLLGPAALSPDRLATTIARLFALLGPGNVGSPRPENRHSPERLRLVEYTPPPPPKVRPEPHRGYGLLATRVLRPPVELEVITQTPDQFDLMPDAERDSSLPNHIDAMQRQSGIYRPCPFTRNSLSRLRPLEVDSPIVEDERKEIRIRGRVRIASGPWELEENWWSEQPTEREYWDVELSDGNLYRIYRNRLENRWFADGIYD